MTIFQQFLGKKTSILNFYTGYNYSSKLKDTQEKTLGSFQPKIMTKIEVISQKPLKKLDFWQNGHFLTVFGQKWLIFEFFFQKSAWNIVFTLPKPYLTAKFQKKSNKRMSRYRVTYIRTYVQTGVNLQVCLRRDQKYK